MMIDPREEKLPVWARELLASERSRADEARAQRTRVWHGEYRNPVYVPRHHGHHRVHFELGAPGDHYTEIQVGITSDGRLEIQGGHSVCLDLQSSNTFQVRFI